MPSTIRDKMRAIEAREEGMGYRQIAKIVGVSRTTVRRWTNPDYLEKSRRYGREWTKRNRKKERGYEQKSRSRNRCASCGQSGVYEDGCTCQRCRCEERHFRRVEIARLWNEGWLPQAIADEVGTTRWYIEREIQIMRHSGEWELARRVAPRK